MKKTTLYSIQSGLRFRRWSRVKYAMFASLGVCVSIGVVSNNIAEKSVSKTSKIIAEFIESFSTTESDQNDDSLEYALFTKQLQEILISENSSDYTAAKFFKIFHLNG